MRGDGRKKPAPRLVAVYRLLLLTTHAALLVLGPFVGFAAGGSCWIALLYRKLSLDRPLAPMNICRARLIVLLLGRRMAAKWHSLRAMC